MTKRGRFSRTLAAQAAEGDRLLEDIVASRRTRFWPPGTHRDDFFFELVDVAAKRNLGRAASRQEFANSVLTLVRASIDEGLREQKRRDITARVLDRVEGVREAIRLLDFEIKCDKVNAESYDLTWEQLADAAQPLREYLAGVHVRVLVEGTGAPAPKPGPRNLAAVFVCEMIAGQYHRCFGKISGGAGRRGLDHGTYPDKRATPYHELCNVVDRYIVANGRPERLTDPARIAGFKRWVGYGPPGQPQTASQPSWRSLLPPSSSLLGAEIDTKDTTSMTI